MNELIIADDVKSERYELRDEVEVDYIEDEAVVYIGEDLVLALNETAQVVVSGLSEGSDVGEIVKKMIEEYKVSEAVAIEDITKCITKLVNHGAIRKRD